MLEYATDNKDGSSSGIINKPLPHDAVPDKTELTLVKLAKNYT